MGDFSANFHRPESGIHTVEGTKSGSRAMQLEQKRQREQEEFEKRKKQITDSYHNAASNINDKFTQEEVLTKKHKESFKTQTVGLVSAEEFKRINEEAAKAATDIKNQLQSLTTLKGKELQLSKEREGGGSNDNNKKDKKKKSKKKKLKEKKKLLSKLSFAGEEEEELLEEEKEQSSKSKMTKSMTATTAVAANSSKSKKDPTIDTSFLPDKLRDEQLLEERIRIEKEWKEKQIEIQNEELEITYSYWDGTGHRRVVIVKKGNTIGEFLEVVRQQICKEFRHIAGLSSSENLLYVKEDLIIPHDITFYDLIVTKARGKSGPLFHFDVHDDLRVGAVDVRIEKDESHPGKVVERRWYDRNKHIFPASRWEVYDPSKDYGSYTIGDLNKCKN